MAELTLTADNFEQTVTGDKPVLVDFWASWCGPCRMIAPIIEEIANERPDITVGKVNIDEQKGLAIRFGIEYIPTLLCFKNGKVVNTITGYADKESILELF